MEKGVGEKSVFQLAWPIFLDISLRILTGSINIFMVGQISTMSVAALSVGNQIFGLSIVIFNFIGIGTCVAVAQMIGAGDKHNIRKLVHNALGFNIISGLGLFLAILLFGHQILNLMQIDAFIHNDAHLYMTVLAISFIPESIGLCCASVIRGYGFTRDAMYSSLAANITTVLSNTLLLFGFFGLPKMGIAGAAFSIVLGRVVAMIVVLYKLRNRTQIRIIPRFLFAFRKKFLSRILRIGLPSAGENLAWDLMFMVTTAFVASLGNYELATHTFYFNTICMYMMVCSISIGMATEVKVAFLIGARRYTEAYGRLMRSLGAGFFISFAIAAVMACGVSNFVLSLFSSGDQSVLVLAAPLILLSVFLEPGRAFNIIVINSLRAANDVYFPVIMAIISMWGIAVPLAYFLGIKMEYGLLGIWIALAADEWIRGLAMFFRWKSRVWQRKLEANALKL